MKARVYRNISGEKLTKLAPPSLRGQVALRRYDKESCLFTLLVFPTQQKDAIVSGPVSHMLSGVTQSDRLVAFGGCFTLEALAILDAHRVEVFAQSDFPWTDEGIQDIRNFISSPAKFPRGT